MSLRSSSQQPPGTMLYMSKRSAPAANRTRHVGFVTCAQYRILRSSLSKAWPSSNASGCKSYATGSIQGTSRFHLTRVLGCLLSRAAPRLWEPGIILQGSSCFFAGQILSLAADIFFRRRRFTEAGARLQPSSLLRPCRSLKQQDLASNYDAPWL